MSTTDTATVTVPLAVSERREKRPPSWIRRVLLIISGLDHGVVAAVRRAARPVAAGSLGDRRLAAATLTFLPLLFLTRALSGAYPSAAVRLLMFRPFWYTQLILPLTASAGAIAFVARRAVFGGAIERCDDGAHGGGDLRGSARSPVMSDRGGCASRRSRRDSRICRKASMGCGSRRFPTCTSGRTRRPGICSDRPSGRSGAVPISSRSPATRSTITAATSSTSRARSAACRAPLGVFAIAGNHDVYAGWPEVRAGMERMGITVLVNEARALFATADVSGSPEQATRQAWAGR